jgi:superfamily II DNA/RNA helicase
MKQPQKILVQNDQLTLEGIRQYYIAVENDSMKFDTLKSLFTVISLSQCIIYCNSIKRVADLAEAMTNEGFSVSSIHSNMEKDTRIQAYNEFKSGISRVLISSNVTARGIDIQQVSTVINFDLPNDIHLYIHRIGRSGRWGRKGNGINFITRRDIKKIKEIEAFYSTQIEELPANFSEKI